MMKIQTRFILFVVLIHLLVLTMSYFVLRENTWLFLGLECLVLLSVGLSFRLYKDLIEPLQLLGQGLEAIKDKDFTVKLIETGSPETDSLIGVYNQMMDALRNERLKQEEQHLFLDKLVRHSPTGIIILDFDGRITDVNPAALLLLELSSTQNGSHQTDRIHSALPEIQTLVPGEPVTRQIRPGVTIRIQSADFVDRGFRRRFIILEDLSKELLLAEKKSYEKIIRMMAHEVNNTVGPVNSILDSARKWTESGNSTGAEALTGAFQVAYERNQNLNQFMHNLAELVRLPAPRKQTIDLHKLLHDTVRLMEITASGQKVCFKTEIPDEPFSVQADLHLMEQAVINILKNAMEAAGTDGIVSIHSAPSEGKLWITNSGPGISEDIRSQLFSPFFSTKKDGQGIGLMLIRDILNAHEFPFSLETHAPGQTVFEIRFPHSAN
ncbi:MAG TPA: ATP-binding protein [Catalimonadaceae bacterium]|nr:ATP-binding protein [Catalimonadaceae bacterium]HPI10488.1 ATP-binding protein [Catalimonadaceae bacterium]